jgi:glycosyltransferase involved in cell wall biosynthesis
MPFLSVVIPTYNRRASLEVTLEGLARQRLAPELFEVVVVSDGSTDGTDVFLTECAARMPFCLRAFRQDNAGPARARNRGVREARGEVIVFLDDDVEPAEDFLSHHAAHHEADDRVAVIGPMSPDPARRRKEPVWIAWEHAMLAKQYENWRTGVWPGAGPNHFYTGNASLRRAHILAVGGFDETFKRQEDVEMAYRMQQTCHVHYRFDPAPAGVHRPQRSFTSWLKVPYEYGRLDVIRAQRGDITWSLVQQAYHTRSRATRRLADLVLGRPTLSPVARWLLTQTAQTLHRLGHPLGIAVLSSVYNVRYLQGALAELGSVAELQRVLGETAGSTIPMETNP